MSKNYDDLRDEIATLIIKTAFLEESLKDMLKCNDSDDKENLAYGRNFTAKLLKHHLKLPHDKQLEYNRKHQEMICLYIQIATLCEQANEYKIALDYYFQAMLHGQVELIFPHANEGAQPNHPFKSKDDFYNGLASLFGVGQERDIKKAQTIFSNLKNNRQPHCDLILGLIDYYALSDKPDPKSAKHYFKSAHRAGIPLASEHLGLCELLQSHEFAARKYLKIAANSALPISQVTLAVRYQSRHGLFFARPEKAEQLQKLAKEQFQVQRRNS